MKVPTGFTLMEGLADTLAAGARDTFMVQLDTATMIPKALGPGPGRMTVFEIQSQLI